MVGNTYIPFDNVYFCEYVSHKYGSPYHEIKFTPLLQHGFFLILIYRYKNNK